MSFRAPPRPSDASLAPLLTPLILGGRDLSGYPTTPALPHDFFSHCTALESLSLGPYSRAELKVFLEALPLGAAPLRRLSYGDPYHVNIKLWGLLRLPSLGGLKTLELCACGEVTVEHDRTAIGDVCETRDRGRARGKGECLLSGGWGWGRRGLSEGVGVDGLSWRQ